MDAVVISLSPNGYRAFLSELARMWTVGNGVTIVQRLVAGVRVVEPFQDRFEDWDGA